MLFSGPGSHVSGAGDSASTSQFDQQNGLPHLHKQASSSVSSSIAEFIPMRSIIKTQYKSVAELDSFEVVCRPIDRKVTSQVASEQKQKKKVKFDDMILICDDEAKI